MAWGIIECYYAMLIPRLYKIMLRNIQVSAGPISEVLGRGVENIVVCSAARSDSSQQDFYKPVLSKMLLSNNSRI